MVLQVVSHQSLLLSCRHRFRVTPRVRLKRGAKIYFYWSANGGGKTASNLVYPMAKDERRRVEDEAERRAVLISEALRF